VNARSKLAAWRKGISKGFGELFIARTRYGIGIVVIGGLLLRGGRHRR
jgi:hypothetical protein